MNLPVIKKYWLPLILAVFGLMFFMYGLISLLGTNSKPSEVTFTKAEADTKAENMIMVDIEGAVVNPGVYKVKQNSIAQDVLIKAKGLSEEADRDFVAKSINLAAKLTDGQKIYIPKIGEASSSENFSVLGTSAESSSLININTASQAQLDSLPGIGPVTSGKIISGRPYTNINQLLDKKVVTNSVFTKIKDKITAF